MHRGKHHHASFQLVYTQNLSIFISFFYHWNLVPGQKEHEFEGDSHFPTLLQYDTDLHTIYHT